MAYLIDDHTGGSVSRFQRLPLNVLGNDLTAGSTTTSFEAEAHHAIGIRMAIAHVGRVRYGSKRRDGREVTVKAITTKVQGGDTINFVSISFSGLGKC